MILVRDVMDSAAALLNDYGKEIYTYTVQLPYVKIALKDLVSDMELNESQFVEEIAYIVIPAGNKSLGNQTIPAYPLDFRFPLDLAERAAGSSERFQDMHETEWEVDIIPSTYLIYWSYREGEVKFPGATRDIEIELRYTKDPPAIQSENSVIVYGGADSLLHYKLAALLSRYVGSNETRANSLNAFYLDYLRKFLAVGVKQRHAFPISRPGFRQIARGK
jgi:hypothetical protein